VSRLYSVSLVGGGPPVQLDANLPVGSYVYDIEITPNSQRVVFNRFTNGVYTLYSVPIAGGNAIPLSSSNLPTPSIGAFKISPDSNWVVYEGRLLAANTVELFRSPVANPAQMRLNVVLGSTINGDDITNWQFEMTPDSQRVVYMAETDSFTSPLYNVSINGGASTKLNGDPGNLGPNWFQVAPDGSKVVYIDDEDVADRFEIYSVPTNGGGATLNSAMGSNEDVLDFKISPTAGSWSIKRTRTSTRPLTCTASGSTAASSPS
jgi:hypothetical protein